MKTIVVTDKFWGIGKNNDLLFRLKEDMKHFKQHTLNKVVVMGHNTLKSLPDGKPLKERVNIVLGAPASQDYIAVKNLSELFNVLKGFETNNVYVVGGARVYKTLLPYCAEAVVTKVDADGTAEVFFEDLNKHSDWVLAEESETVKDGEYSIKFCRYINNNIKDFSEVKNEN